MALSKNEIQKRSDEKRGVKLCSFKFKLQTIELLEQTAQQLGLSKTAILEQALHEFVAKQK